MIEQGIGKIDRRELFGLLLPRKKEISVAKGSIVIPNKPPTPDNPSSIFGKLALVGGALASLNLNLELDRRPFLKWAGITGGIAALVASKLFLPNRVEAEGYQIERRDYKKSLGRDISYPWLGGENGLKAAGLEEGGPWDKYDRLDKKINGYRARSIYWPEMGGPGSTREWLTWVYYEAIEKEALKRGPVNDMDTARARAASWTGYCLDGAAASYFAPLLRGSFPRTILGEDFYQEDVMTVATMAYSGLAREPLDLNNTEEVARRINSGEAVGINYSEIDWQDWWGLAINMTEDGMVTIVRSSELGDSPTLLIITKHISELREAVVLDENGTQPGYEGNRAVVNPEVGGLILQTHQLLAA